MTTCTRVAIVRTTPTTIHTDYTRLLELVGIQQIINPYGSTVLNLCKQKHFPFPGANTPPWQLESVASILQQCGHHRLFAPGQPTEKFRTLRGDDLDGYRSLLRAYHITEHNGTFFNGTEWYHSLAIPINLVCLHPLTLRPYVPLQRRFPPRRSHATDDHTVDYMHKQRAQCTHILTILDGSSIHIGDTVEVKNILIASTDLVAPYTVAAMLWGVEPLRDVSYIRMACEQGLGVGDDHNIALVGDITDKAYFKHSIGRNTNTSIRENPSILNNYYRWTSRERRIFESWLHHTEWGKLFQHYQKHGVLYPESLQQHDTVST